jgi:hypothetical protein
MTSTQQNGPKSMTADGGWTSISSCLVQGEKVAATKGLFHRSGGATWLTIPKPLARALAVTGPQIVLVQQGAQGQPRMKESRFGGRRRDAESISYLPY